MLRTVIILGIVCFALVVVLADHMYYGEQPYRSYLDQPAAVDPGEVRRGWLPEWIPTTATDLQIQGDLDSNRRWIRFNLPASANDALRNRLELIPDAMAGPIVVCGPLRGKK